MRFYTEDESMGWLTAIGQKLPEPDGSVVHRVNSLKNHSLCFVAEWIANSITCRDESLLLVTEWGIWPTSENWRLYYKLRQSYADQNLLHEAPGHFFLMYETQDLATFLQVAMLNGWGGYVLTKAGYVNVFFSHDGYLDFYADSESNLADVRGQFPRESETDLT